jgi:flagellum-specific ATP synthase
VSLLAAQIDAVESAMPLGVSGRVEAISGLTIEASELPLPLGSMCKITSLGGRSCRAEVIGFQSERTLLMPLTATVGVARGDRVENIAAATRVWTSSNLLGRVLDGFGNPIDGRGPIVASESRRIDGRSIAPLHREPIREAISTGVRAIDGLLTCGKGQRMGIFSGPGVGKSTLISCIARNTDADVSVIALIGERGREVQEFLEDVMAEPGLGKCVVIATTGDDTPLLRVRAAQMATTISEYFRDEGKHVLLVMDSLTRMCQAQQQIGLAAKEPPARRGYPPSVFALLPQVLERAGNTPRGSITGFYTVLVEGDDFTEPIADAVKGITDGQLWLSRGLANRGHFPAIDVLQSISRVREQVVDESHLKRATRTLSLLATYNDIEDLVNVGAYVPGVNREFDLAVQCRSKINDFLKQSSKSAISFEQAERDLAELCKFIELADRKLAGPLRR